MWARIKSLLIPPVFEGDEDRTRVAGLLNTVLLAMLAVAVLVGLAMLLTADPWTGLLSLGILILLVFGALILLRLGRVQVATALFSFTLWAFDTAVILVSGGTNSPLTMIYIVAIIVTGLLLGGRAAIVLAGLSIAAGAGMFYAQWRGVLFPVLLPVGLETGLLSLAGTAIPAAAFLYVATRDINEALQRARSYAAELEERQGQLADLVQARTEELSRRTSYLGATTAVAREAASVLDDPQELLRRVVALVSDRFGFYHTGLFMLDEAREWAVLQAASSEGGQRMLARGHRLRVGRQGIVGYVAGRGVHRVALNVGGDALFFDDQDLPDTRSELALPLRFGGEIVGVLDVQSREPEAFSEEDVDVLQALADQVAVAITSARLFRQAEESLESEQRLRGELTRAAWMELIQEHPDLGFLSDARGTAAAGDVWDAEMVAAVQTGEAAAGDGDVKSLAVPVKTRGQVVGVIDAHLPDDAAEWTPEQRELLETLAEQLGIALESAQLYLDAQRRAMREQATREITDRMRSTTDMDELLQTAIRETASVLGAARAFVQWVPSERATGEDERSSI